jgi:hypothetical protein
MRLIDADVLLSDIERTIGESGCVNHEGEIMDCVRYASEVDAVPVVRGEWIQHHETTTDNETLPYGWECSLCGRWEMEKQPFCNCGAKMEDKP